MHMTGLCVKSFFRNLEPVAAVLLPFDSDTSALILPYYVPQGVFL